MKTITDNTFLKEQYNLESIVGVRIYNGNIYFLAWMEDAIDYKIQKVMNHAGYLLDKTSLMLDGDIFTCIANTVDYEDLYSLYEVDENQNPIHEEDKAFANTYEKFLSLMKYKLNTKEHIIILLTQAELAGLCGVCEILRDGDYIFVISN